MEQLRTLADFILDEAKAQGADMAQCSLSKSEKKEFNVENGAFTLMRTLFSNAVAITVYKDKKQGMTAINCFDEEAIRNAVADAIAAASSAEPDDAWEMCEDGAVHADVRGPLSPDIDKLFFRTQELLDTVTERYPKLIVGSIVSEYDRGTSLYKNSFGTTFETETGLYGYSMDYSAHEGDTSSHIYGSGCALNDLETPFIECSITEKELSDTEKQASPEPFAEKMVGTVVFTPGCLADVVFGTILGAFVSDMPLIDGTSTWKEKLGQQVADERITLRLAPGDDRIVAGSTHTGEGYKAEDFTVIENGVLKSFVLSQYAANKTGLTRSENTSSAMIVENGEDLLEDIIKGIDRGILVGRFSGGQPGANGEFSGIAKNSFLIENGKITRALAETMISANLNDMLMSLRAVSREVDCDGTKVVPYMAFDGVTISGK